MVPVDDAPKFFRVFQSYAVQPAARHRDGMMMQGYQAMTPIRILSAWSSCARVFSLSRPLAEPGRQLSKARYARHEVGEPPTMKGLPEVPGALPQDRHDCQVCIALASESPKHTTDVCISARIVLHEIAGDEYNIGRPCRRLLRVASAALSAGNVAIRAMFPSRSIKVRIGELDRRKTLMI